MKPFLKQIVQTIIQKHSEDLNEVCIVLPGKRPTIYLRKYFAEELTSTAWLPDMIGINEFVEQATGNKVIDKNELLFRFFEIYQSQKNYKGESFDSFMLWAVQVIADYSDIDNYLKDGKVVFQDLTNLKEMDAWGRDNMGDDDFSWSFNQKPLSSQQENFLSFWEKIGDLYQVLNKYCLQNEVYYTGLLNRKLAENIESISNKLPWKKIYFVGLNALSASEEKFIFSLIDYGIAETFWDVDNYYLNNPLHEAGMFLRRYQKKLGDLNWTNNYLSEENRKANKLNIRIHETATENTQVKYAGKLLQENPEANIAVILANEKLLIPLLHSLPKSDKKVNVTLGYPLKNTPFYSWIKKTFALLRNSNQGLYFKDFQEWIDHPFLLTLLAGKPNKIIHHFKEKLVADNIAYVQTSSLIKLSKEDDFLNDIFSVFCQEKPSTTAIISYLLHTIDKLKKAFQGQAMELEGLFEYSKIVNRVQGYLEKYSFIQTTDTIEKLIIRLANSTSLSFLGEPLQGNQIMGMLESRILDFEHVIILGANEGHLPGSKKTNSYIPYELKRYYSLPTHKEQEAIFSYNFYRLLQRASSADIFYSTQSETFGSAEESRYISQIKNEFPNVVTDVYSDHITTKQSSNTNKKLTVIVDQQVVSKIKDRLKKGISPSAFNTFLRCPLDFYFRYVVGFSEVNTVEENIQANTFGTIVHEVLEDFYDEIKEEDLTVKRLDSWIRNIDQASEKTFIKVFKSGNFAQGQNYIALEVARKYILNFLKSEKREVERLAKEMKSIKIIALEEKMIASMDLSAYGVDFPVNIKGIADRIDQIGGITRIVDYKTGGTEQKNLNVKSDLTDITEGKKPKALQVLLYAFAYHKSKGVAIENISSGIISFKNLNNGFMEFKKTKKKGDPNSSDLIELTKEAIAKIVLQMTKEDQEWKHEVKSDFCTYC